MSSGSKTKLSVKERSFVNEYLISMNALQSFIKAGYAKKTANVCSSQLLAKPRILSAVTKALEKKFNKLDISSDRVLTEAARIAFSDPRVIFDEQGCLLPIKDWPDDIARAVSSVEIEENFVGVGEMRRVVGHTKKIKFWNKNQSVEQLMKYCGLFERDNAQKPAPVIQVLVYSEADKCKP